MANKADRVYFENFAQAAESACKAAHFLVDCLTEYHPENVEQMVQDLHLIEQAGDIKKHEMSSLLAKAFVTPVDREDMALISQNIDDVTDSIEEILQRFYVDKIRSVLPEAVEFAQKLTECCELMKQVLEEFCNFKKPAKLREMIVELNHLEEECDRLYLEATLKVTDHCTDVLEIVYWREIYDRMEDCADACEHVGDCVETVVMKNT